MNFGFERKKGAAKALADLQRLHRKTIRQVEELQNRVQELRAKEEALHLVAATLDELATGAAPLLIAAIGAGSAVRDGRGSGGSGNGGGGSGESWDPHPALVLRVLSLLRDRLRTLPPKDGTSSSEGPSTSGSSHHGGADAASNQQATHTPEAAACPVQCPPEPRALPGWAAHLPAEGLPGAVQRLRQWTPEEIARARGAIMQGAAMDICHMRAGGPAAAAAEARLSDALDRSVALLVSLVVANPVNYARNLPLRLDTGEPLAAVMEFEQCRVAAREMGLSQQQGMVIFAIHEWFDGIYSHITDRRNELLQRQRCCCTEDALEVVPELELGQELLVWAAAAASVTMYTKVLTPTQIMVGAVAMYPASISLLSVALVLLEQRKQVPGASDAP